jgi:hypothetical protein
MATSKRQRQKRQALGVNKNFQGLNVARNQEESRKINAKMKTSNHNERAESNTQFILLIQVLLSSKES